MSDTLSVTCVRACGGKWHTLSCGFSLEAKALCVDSCISAESSIDHDSHSSLHPTPAAFSHLIVKFALYYNCSSETSCSYGQEDADQCHLAESTLRCTLCRGLLERGPCGRPRPPAGLLCSRSVGQCAPREWIPMQAPQYRHCRRLRVQGPSKSSYVVLLIPEPMKSS